MGGEGRVGGFLKVIPTVGVDDEQEERWCVRVTSRWKVTSGRRDGR
jgi:hypothetical protein